MSAHVNAHWYGRIGGGGPAGRRLAQLLILSMFALGLGIAPTAAWAAGRPR
ncbi:hypothetical protein [Kitasatospora sp. NPDC001527]|uniref:hypothetical protein n=1 Tax=Kitasatospora sp. NPDC001527 TaxID=3154519 RepID=UPI00331728DD